MMSTDFSVLFLAWDDADPGVAVLGGAALPPTLPLVYQLAAQRPVLAVYPHLPTAEATTALEQAASAPIAPADASPAPPAAAEATVPPSPLDAVADAPGVHLLATAEPTAAAVASAGSSRLVGLDDLLPAVQRPLPTAHSLGLPPEQMPSAAPAARTTAPSRNQWPGGAAPHRTAWQAPAAPYAGAAAVEPRASAPVSARAKVREKFPPPPPAPPRPAAPPPAPEFAADVPAPVALAVATAAPVSPPADSEPAGTAATGNAEPAPALFMEPVAEIGSAEANDLAAPEDDLVPESRAAAATKAAPEPVADAPEPVAAWAVRQPALDGLNFRMIQYARRAAQLTDGREDFDVIYAPGWPAWLAALEIRNRSGRPLVLYAAALASDAAPAAERGWLLGVERMVLRRARLVLVPNADMQQQLRSRFGEAVAEIRILPADDQAAVQLVLAEVALG